jgi:hypothetical protein
MTGSDLQAASSITCMLCAKTKCCERSAAGSRDFGNHLFVFASHAAVKCSSLDLLLSTAQATRMENNEHELFHTLGDDCSGSMHAAKILCVCSIDREVTLQL